MSNKIDIARALIATIKKIDPATDPADVISDPEVTSFLVQRSQKNSLLQNIHVGLGPFIETARRAMDKESKTYDDTVAIVSLGLLQDRTFVESCVDDPHIVDEILWLAQTTSS